MKRLLFLFIVLCCAIACKKKSSSETGASIQSSNPVDSMAALSTAINGFQWRADSVLAYTIQSSTNDSGKSNLMITAVSKKADSPRTIVLNITDFGKAGTYSIQPPAVTATYYLRNVRYYATSGEIIITSRSAGSLKGTFSFVADSFAITNGTFNVSLP